MDQQESPVPNTKQLPRRAILLTLLLIGTLGSSVGGYQYAKSQRTQQSTISIFQQPTDPQMTIAVYYPQNLPAGYVYNNDAKILQPDVYYFSITGPKQQSFHVTQQAIPADFDFVAFNKKFLTPSVFDVDAGSATTGAVGANTISSIKTRKNTWILINSSVLDSRTQVEIIARSLEPAQ